LAKSFINACLEKDPANRLGTTNDAEEILSHEWLADLDCKALENK